MGAKVLIVFHSAEGQTRRIAERIATRLRDLGDEVEVCSLMHAPGPDGFDAVVAGDPIHATRHSRAFTRYLRQHAEALNAMPSAFFQVSLTSANPDATHTAAAQKLVDELLDHTGFAPDVVAMFAGALVYTRYGWLKRRLMRAIVKREGGDVDTSRDYEYTDWDAVDRFTSDFERVVRANA